MSNAKALGLDLSTVICMIVNRLVVEGQLSDSFFQPNSETLQAIRELENGKDVHHVNTIDELKRDLGW
ncbi:type II toxin-antitoxin system RelB/DinJ family antitoxin [Xenorhabdus sp. PB62.4]|uniref:type II toxin-antitoxin system RelB/DinJ family antitoxin n=1 Tax=Xenorhabdus sp. PB62.4 TaxID=1851573 RepID=UPI0016576076|nr:type II toxin-antitoxin system RelB/DinJ family antitoxin [Xenorhabdus sp. PB62.4]MBC8953017.1 damage-inducible protein J [Xenorhabdus sp. PB62.4]